ncbi:MAG: HAD family hydrolase, partial [Actinobacteria bacterium]|nr:HAD family hydrolase [Actinomycetota bacterium]
TLGGVWTDEIKAAVVGTRLDVSVPTILRWYGVEPTPARVAETAAWLLHRVAELYSGALPARAGVCELLAGLREEGVPMALVSSSFRVLVDAVLAHGFGPFDVTLAGDEVACGKPDPEPYLTAAARLGADPAHCVVLEDSPAGVASGLAAGCSVLAVPSVDGVEFAPAPRLAVAADLCGVTVATLREMTAPA